jgi:hypothetical protein
MVNVLIERREYELLEIFTNFACLKVNLQL